VLALLDQPLLSRALSKLLGYVTPEAPTSWRPSLVRVVSPRCFPLRWQAHSERRTHLRKVLQDTKAKGDDIARRMQPLVAQLGDTIKHLDQVRPARCLLLTEMSLNSLLLLYCPREHWESDALVAWSALKLPPTMPGGLCWRLVLSSRSGESLATPSYKVTSGVLHPERHEDCGVCRQLPDKA
jgi:hypothetical protein